ncbi:type I polyketide synthase [Ruminiclostridium josui]|uniref:type I polyketide synthase n=1 Tax=Ruminiclostridium josui TaxID=1499 RepID=UPI0006D1B724|nr:type I polyketide synthase [Ruminiclostridium josui]
MSKKEKRGSFKSNKLEDYIKLTIAQKISETLKVDMDKIGYGDSLSDYGLDSIIAVNLVRIIGQALNIDLDITIMFEYSTINQLADYIISKYGEVIGSSIKQDTQLANIEDEAAAAAETSEIALNNTINWTTKLKVFSQSEEVKKQEQIKEIQDSFAIIGISGRFPKGDSLSEFWDNLINGEDCIIEIPQERWSDWRHWYSDYKDEMEAMQSKRGGFISGVAEFDPLFFGISPKEAEYICPEQRLLLTYIWYAIEDAGINPKALPGISTGVFIAATPSDYRGGKMGANTSDSMSLSANSSPSMMANRISYILNLSGPSECCETGCSSAMVALHRAIQSIKNHECEQAIIGAVNLLLSPVGFINLESANLLSKEGKSKSFQKDADGFVRSEGVGAIIIKPLSKAIADNDRIYAVVKGTSVAHGGKGVSLFAPNASGMKTAMMQAYRSAGIDPRTVSYIEAHGIGGTLADSIEINALKSGYQELIASAQEDSPIPNCYISSLKPCIGHGEIFSGLAGLLKVILALQKRIIPGIPGFGFINEDISLDRSPFLISSENHKWDVLVDSTGKQLPRRASINSYGLGGVNAHVVLEEYVPENEEPQQCYSENTSHIIVLSAKNKERLLAASKQLLEFVQSQQEYSLLDLEYTLQTGRQAMEVRLAMVVRNHEDLVKALRQYLGQATDKDLKGNTQKIFEGILEEQLNGLFSGKIGDIMLQALLEEKDPEKLALYWVNGNDIPWEALHEGEKTRKISVPNYPFEKQLYWIGSEQTNELEPQKAIKLLEGNEHFSEEISLSEYIVDIVSNLLKIEASKMKLNVPVEQYGIDSIMLMPLLQQLQTRIAPAINLTGLQKCRTLQDIIDMSAEFAKSDPVMKEVNTNRIMPTAWTGFPELIHLNKSSYGTPIFWIHGALGGVEAYKLIGENIERPFFGIQARGWMTNHTPLHGIYAMASYYTHIIQTIQPEGPYDIGGFCMGGILAYEITRQLQELGQTVSTLVMIDSPDNTFQESLTGFNKNAVKNIIFQTVNMMLLSSVLQNHGELEKTLIHRMS